MMDRDGRPPVDGGAAAGRSAIDETPGGPPGGADVVEVLITERQIRERVHELGKQIEADYQGRPLTIVAILTGSLIVLADLIRQIQVPLRVALLQASSYKGATTSAGALIINESFAPRRRRPRRPPARRHPRHRLHVVDPGPPDVRPGRPPSVRTAVLLRKRRPPGSPDRARLLRLRHPRRASSSAMASTSTTTTGTCPTSPSCRLPIVTRIASQPTGAVPRDRMTGGTSPSTMKIALVTRRYPRR